jgi:hypothetical protein
MMPKTKKATARVSKVGKGSYAVKLPKRSLKKPAKKAKVVEAIPMFDALPLAVVGYAQVNADGTSDVSKASRNLRVWRISKGHYQAEFETDLIVRSVLVEVLVKPYTRRMFAMVAPLIRHRLLVKLNSVEIFLKTARGVLRDCPFAMLGITDGARLSS